MPKTILIVDDNDDLRSLLAHQLKEKGYRIIIAGDGRQAVEKCRSEKPDLVLMDVMMPGQDGTEAGAAIKSDPLTKHIPIIFLTSIVMDQEREEQMTAGSALPKDMKFEDLLKKIQKVLNK